jgi:hypothetical protein
MEDYMPQFRVFHLKHTTEDSGKHARLDALFGDVDEAVRLGLYQEVAHVEADNIENVFRLTNHVDEDWTEGPAITRVKSPCRSTSVGDIVMDDSFNLYKCASFGFDMLSEEASEMFIGHLGMKIERLDLDPGASPEM